MSSHDPQRDARRTRHATALFADIEASTAMTEALGPELAHERIDSCLRDLRSIARRHGGIAQGRGDGILAIFGVPLAQEDSARAALNAAIEMQTLAVSSGEEEARLPLCIGLSSGPLVYRLDRDGHEAEIDVVGDDANLASRLSDLAAGGEIYVSPSTHAEAGRHFAFEDVGEHPVKGRTKPVRVFALRSRSIRLHRELSSNDDEAMVGRDGTLSTLQTELQRVAESGTRRVALVLGDAGIGKSTLVETLARSVRREAQPLFARSIRMGAALPHDPFRRLLREFAGIGDESNDAAHASLQEAVETVLGEGSTDAFPFLARLAGFELHGEAKRHFEQVSPEALEIVVHRSFAMFLEALAEREPLVVVLEDLHWSDESSRALALHLVQVLADRPVLFVLVSRPEATLETWRNKLVDACGREALREVPLSALGTADAEHLIERLSGDVRVSAATRQAILGKSRGNPLFLGELTRAVVRAARSGESAPFLAELPGTLTDLVTARIDQLPSAARRLLEEAAALAMDAPVSLLAKVTDAPEALRESLAHLCAEGLLTETSGTLDARYDFVHPLTRDAAYASILSRRRREIHGRVARALADDLSPGGAPLLAYHFSRSDDTEAAEAALVEAGRQAARAAAPEEALLFFRRAADAFLSGSSVDDPQRLLEIRKHIALALFYRGSYIEAAQALDQLLALLGHETPPGRVRQALRFARNLALFSVMSRIYTTRPPARQATDQDREILEIMMLRSRAQTTADPLRFLFDGTECLARSLAFHPDSVPIAASIHAGAMGPFSYGGLSFSVADRCIRNARALVDPDDPRQLLFTRVMSFVHHLLTGDWDTRHEIDEALLREGIRLGQVWDATTYLGLFALRLLHQGRFDESQAVIDRLQTIDSRYAHEYARSNWHGLEAFLALKRGDAETAIAAATTYANEHDEPAMQIQAFGTRAQAHAALNRREAARADLERAEEALRAAGRVAPFQAVVLERARLHLLLRTFEDPEGAAPAKTLRGASRALSRLASKVAWERPEALRLRARMEAASGSASRAATTLSRALDACRALGAEPEQARTLRDAAALASEAGIPVLSTPARQLDEEARALSRRLDLADS